MESIVRNAIARIDVIDAGRNLSRGTGALITPNLVLTAFHVVADRRQDALSLYPGEIQLTFPGHSTKAVLHESYWAGTRTRRVHRPAADERRPAQRRRAGQ